MLFISHSFGSLVLLSLSYLFPSISSSHPYDAFPFLPLTLPQVQREFFPTLLDICIEYDRGYRPSNHPISKGDMLSSSGQDLKEVEANLSWSRIVGKNNRFPLDWGTLTSLFSAFGPGEQENYGIQVLSISLSHSSLPRTLPPLAHAPPLSMIMLRVITDLELDSP